MVVSINYIVMFQRIKEFLSGVLAFAMLFASFCLMVSTANILLFGKLYLWHTGISLVIYGFGYLIFRRIKI